MRPTLLAALAAWQVAIQGGGVVASPLHLQGRQASNASLDAVADDASAAVSSTPASAGASVTPRGSVTATLFQGANKAYEATPAAPTEPATGCVIATQTPTTITEVFTYDLIPSTSYESDFITLTQGLYCTCAGGLMAGMASSYNQEGTMYLFCATGGPLSATNAISTSSPQASAEPGNPLNPDWADVTCDYGSLPNDNGAADPWAMWNDSGADAAWNSMYSTYELVQTSTYLNFSNWLINYFHGPEGTNCDLVGQGSCDSPASCGQYTSPNAVINSPAGYMIWASMEGLHQILEAFNTGVIAAVGQIGLNVDSFTQEFSPITDELAAIQHEKVILDIILLVVGVAVVGLFEAALPALPFIAAAEGGAELALNTAKVSIYLSMGTSFGLVKDRMNPPTVDTVEAQVSSYISGVTNALEGAVTLLAAAIFDTPDVLKGLVQNGQFFAPGGKNQIQAASSFDVSQKMQEYIFANALPMAWSTGTSQKVAFIATGTGVAGDGASGCDGYDPATILIQGVFQGQQPVYVPTNQDATDFFQSVFFCINNTPYWLMTGHTSDEYRGIYVEQPTNLASLDGKSWGSLTGEAVVSSAVNTWKSNGNQNNANAADPTNFDTIESWATSDLADISGMVMIPVCTFQQAAQGATDDKSNSAQNPFWPCPASGTTG